MAATRIHHINFVVRDLDSACAAFERMLGLAPFETIDHAPRGAHVARSRLGDGWLVLVCPYDPASVPGRYLEQHGEGFFLLSVATDDIDTHLAALCSKGAKPADRAPREGILNWRVADLGELHGALLQLTAEDGTAPDAAP